MKTKRLIRVGIQVILSGLLFFGLIGSAPELKLLFVTLMIVNLTAILLSTFITSTLGKQRIFSSILFNLGVSVLFFFIGYYLHDLLTYEVIEQVEPDENDPFATVVKARLVSFGGIQFLLIALVHSFLSYVDFFEIQLSREEPDAAEMKGRLFSVRVGKKLHLIPFSEIDFIEASGNYIHIYQGDIKYPARLSLQEFEEKAKTENLIRVHRSFIINLGQIRELEGTNDGYQAVLRSGRKIKIGKQYKQELFRLLGIEN